MSTTMHELHASIYYLQMLTTACASTLCHITEKRTILIKIRQFLSVNGNKDLSSLLLTFNIQGLFIEHLLHVKIEKRSSNFELLEHAGYLGKTVGTGST